MLGLISVLITGMYNMIYTTLSYIFAAPTQLLTMFQKKGGEMSKLILSLAFCKHKVLLQDVMSQTKKVYICLF